MRSVSPTTHTPSPPTKHCRVFHRIEREDSLEAFVTPLHRLNLINIHLLATRLIIITLTPILIELEIAIAIALLSIRIRLVDLRALRQLAIGFEGTRFVGRVLEYHVAFLVLVVAQGQQDDVALVDPDFLAELAADVGEAFGAVEAEGFEAAVAKHLEDLGVFWESLLVVVVVG